MRIRATLASAVAVVACAATLATPAPAQAAGSSCRGYVTKSHRVTWAAFAGHKLVLDFKECSYRPRGFVGPVKPGIRGTSRPVLTHPTTIPFGGGETLSTQRDVYHVSTTASRFTYRFVMRQGHVVTPRLTNSYTFEFQIRRLNTPIARICFYGRNCSRWQN